MGYKLCTAEKPSVARDIARCVGATEKKNGYIQGNGYIVTWAVGHLVQLCEPEKYGYLSQKNIYDKEHPENKEKAVQQLPLFPDNFKTEVKPETADQYKVMCELMKRDDIDYIIDCGDMGAEGHILQWFIRQQAGNTHPVKRFCATSLTDEAIKEAMGNLRDGKEFEKIIEGEYCKKKADWILGMSMSRMCSIKYNARVDVGRVQSPTLYFIVKRFIEVSTFKVQNYYTLTAKFADFNLYFNKDTNNVIAAEHKDDQDRIIIRTAAEAIMEITRTQAATITSIETTQKKEAPPQLYDITELQRDGNRMFGYTADETLKTAQSLYETYKILSYPRTDSRYITSDLVPYMAERVEKISKIDKYSDAAELVLKTGLQIDKRICDDSKVTDHHALIVTEIIDTFKMENLNEKEKNIINLVIARMLTSFSPKYVYDETEIKAKISSYEFGAKGKTPVINGWKDIKNMILGKEENESEETKENQTFPKLIEGQTLLPKAIEINDKKTTPPKLHTEASLLTAMENAGAKIENGEILKGKGIGTQATRAAIIKSLFDKKYVMNQGNGKTKYLVPTKAGMNVIKIIPKELYSPKVTADWEMMIADIVENKITPNDFMEQFRKFITEKVEMVKDGEKVDVDFSFEKVKLCECPWCKKDVVAGKITAKDGKTYDSVYCASKCGFSLSANNIIYMSRTKKPLSAAQLKQLATKGKIKAKCISKNETEYNGIFNLVKQENGYASLEFEFEKKK